MSITMQQGYPDRIGRRYAFCVNYVGPASYVNSGTASTSGDPFSLPEFQNYIDAIPPAVTTDGSYIIFFEPSAAGPRATWKARWFALTSASGVGAEAANATPLSGKTAIVMGFGGAY